MSKYILVEKKPEDREQFIVTITGDSNDGDLITDSKAYIEKGFLFVLDELKNFKLNYFGHKKLREYGNDYGLPIPYSDDGVCHTLEKVTIEYIDKDGKIFDVHI